MFRFSALPSSVTESTPCYSLRWASVRLTFRWADVSVAAETVSGDGLECRRYLLHDLRRRLNGAKRDIEQLRQLDLVPITRDHAVELRRTGHPGAIDADRDRRSRSRRSCRLGQTCIAHQGSRRRACVVSCGGSTSAGKRTTDRSSGFARAESPSPNGQLQNYSPQARMRPHFPQRTLTRNRRDVDGLPFRVAPQNSLVDYTGTRRRRICRPAAIGGWMVMKRVSTAIPSHRSKCSWDRAGAAAASEQVTAACSYRPCRPS